ncbi:MAG: hypothetical protein K8S62_06325 [Candidatus Sabulitectum sp.]|nr:hypothetical protein [Candidatus Sabulitectum sp.]
MEFRSLGTRLRYYVNDLLIRNPMWQMLVLVIASSAIITIGVLLVDGSVENGFWWSFTRLLDQGTFICDDQSEPHVALVGVLITIGGILVLSLLIGIFSSKITEQLDSLKRGRSPIVEKNHIIVCGDGDRLYEVARELVEARQEGSSRGSIVIFSSRSREEMEEVLIQRMGRKPARQVICRSGDTTDVDSLCLPGFQRCAGFVIIGDDDSAVIKTLIAVNSIRGEGRSAGVCELRDRAKGRIAKMACSDVLWIPVREIVMRLLVQIGRQPGLSAVYSEILSFTGNEFYLKQSPEVEGLDFREISERISRGIAVGIRADGKVILNPSPDMILGSGDSLLVLAENRNSFSFREKRLSVKDSFQEEGRLTDDFLRMLVFSGQSRKFGFMLKLLDNYSHSGAEITVAGSIPEDEGAALLKQVNFKNCSGSYIEMERTNPDSVETLHPGKHDSIMVISGKNSEMSDEEADSECIVTLLILRDIAERYGDRWNATVVSEIRNPRNRRLATAAGIDDFVISNEVCSMIMAQLVIQPSLSQVYEEIFDPSGCEVQLRKVSLYKSRNFSNLAGEGLARREVVLGWLTGTGLKSRVCLNPRRDIPLPSDRDTRIVVIAER